MSRQGTGERINRNVGKFTAAGVKVNQADKDAFIAASKGIYDEFGAEVPGSAALIEQAIALGK